MHSRHIDVITVVAALLFSYATAGPIPKVDAQALKEAAAAEGPKQGIKVHGHWTIEIRDPDGTQVPRREFDNALAPSGGGSVLARVFARQLTVGSWQVGVGGGLCTSDGTPSGTQFVCQIVESGAPTPVASTFATLTVAAAGGTLVLNGSAIAARTGVVYDVRTLFNECPATTTPADTCQVGPLLDITETFPTPSISVSAGQQILVTVVLSFS